MHWRELKRGDIAAILLLIALLGGAVAYAVFPDRFPLKSSGFGPDWECKNPGHGDPVCIKKPISKPDNP
jgi:hypothetical protein